MNGAKRSSSTNSITWPTGVNAQIFTVGYQDFTGIEIIQGRWLMFCIWNRFLLDSEHLQLARDPFGPFRMVDEAAVVYAFPAVAAGNPYYYYRSQ